MIPEMTLPIYHSYYAHERISVYILHRCSTLHTSSERRYCYQQPKIRRSAGAKGTSVQMLLKSSSFFFSGFVMVSGEERWQRTYKLRPMSRLYKDDWGWE